jgi:hypothetical protein
VIAFGLWYCGVWCLLLILLFINRGTRTDRLLRRQEPSLTEWQPLQCPTPSCNSTIGSRNIRSITAEEEAEDPSDEPESGESPGLRLAETWRLDKYAVEFVDRDERYVVVPVSVHIPGSCLALPFPLPPSSPSSPISCNVDEILSTEMLECAQSLGIRKFRLADEVTGEEHMLVSGHAVPCLFDSC